MSKRAAIYSRISRDREGAGLGVERQERECRELAGRLDFDVVATYSDNDLSAYSGKPRPGYRDLLGDVRAGRVDVVACWHTDRLHRSPIELEEWIAAAEPHGVAVHTVKAGPIDLATPSGRMVARQLGAVARYESEHRAERVAAQKAEAREAGRWLGGARPFGFESDGVAVREAEAAMIRSGTAAILSGSSLRGLVRRWNESGVTTSRGSTWTRRSVASVLTRWRNAALMEHDEQPVGPAAWPPLVSEAEVRALRDILLPDSDRTPAEPVGSRSRHLLAGIARCPCGSPVRAVTQTGRPRAYRCSAYDQGGTHGQHVSRRADPVDAFVEDVIAERLGRDDVADLVAPEDDSAAQSGELLAQRASARRRLEEVALLLGDDLITPEQATTASARARARLADADRGLAQAATVSPLVRLAGVPDAVAWWRDPSTDLDDRRAVIRGLMDITVLPGRPGRRPFDPASVGITWRT